MTNQASAATSYSENKLAYYESYYKTNVIAKPQEINLTITSSHIYGLGFICDQHATQEGDLEYKRFNHSLDQITKIYVNDNIKTSPLYIQIDDEVKGVLNRRRIILPCLQGVDKIVEKLYEIKAEYDIFIEKDKKREKKKNIEESEKASVQKKAQFEFFEKTYQEHVQGTERPVYVFEKETLLTSVMYVGEDNSLNFLSIDGENCKYALGVIPYDNIHYYDLARTMHYTTGINGSLFGGSFTNGTSSITKQVIDGLLFGPMGMDVGETEGYKVITDISGNNGASGASYRVDESSVILNYYSIVHKQYVDIEFSSEIYNFLQTYLPEKKYDIVLEVEKQRAAQKAMADFAKQSVEQPKRAAAVVSAAKPAQTAASNEVLPDMTLEEFEIAVKKLKAMRDSELITPKEFNTEKKKLLSLLY